MNRPPLPPFTSETAAETVRLAENAWNTRDPARVALAYTAHSLWRNRSEFLAGRETIEAFLTRKSPAERDYRLIKELWAFDQNRIAVRFAYEWRDLKHRWCREREVRRRGAPAASHCQHQRSADHRCRAQVPARPAPRQSSGPVRTRSVRDAMSKNAATTSDVAFSPTVKAIQEQKGSRRAYARQEEAGGWPDRIDTEIAAFIEAGRMDA